MKVVDFHGFTHSGFTLNFCLEIVVQEFLGPLLVIKCQRTFADSFHRRRGWLVRLLISQTQQWTLLACEFSCWGQIRGASFQMNALVYIVIIPLCDSEIDHNRLLFRAFFLKEDRIAWYCVHEQYKELYCGANCCLITIRWTFS